MFNYDGIDKKLQLFLQEKYAHTDFKVYIFAYRNINIEFYQNRKRIYKLYFKLYFNEHWKFTGNDIDKGMNKNDLDILKQYIEEFFETEYNLKRIFI